MEPKLLVRLFSQKRNVVAMPPMKTYILLLLLTTPLLSCEEPKIEAPIVPALPEPEPEPENPNSNPTSLLENTREKIDHDSKYEKKTEPDPDWILFSDFRAPKPLTWSWTTPSSNMRIANYAIPGDEPDDSCELVIKQFAVDEGKDLPANIERWKSHFRSSGGGPVQPRVTSAVVANMPATIIRINGEYMGLGTSWHRYNHTMLIVLIEYEKGNIYLRLIGPEETLISQQAQWDSFLDSIQLIQIN